MEGSPTTRFARLASALARNPGHLPRYLRTLPAWNRSPIDLELPWFSFGAIDYLERNLRPEHEAFEFGSGGSSIFLARRCRHVRSVENSREWHAIVVERAKALSLSNLSCELHEFGDEEAPRFRELPYFRAIGDGPYDVVIVDGFCGYSTAKYGLLRPYAFELARRAVRRPGGLIVLDDSWMYPDIDIPEAKAMVFESTGPARYGVTRTTLYRF